MSIPCIERLLDPSKCGENLQRNLQRVLRLAPVHCAGCADYHIRCVAHRATGERLGIDSDRPELIALLRDLISDRLGAHAYIDIVIAGAADTGILATAAHTAATLGQDILRRCRFTVLDRCLTPLSLCSDYAQMFKLDYASATVDLVHPDRHFRADILLLHSVFRFIPKPRQTQTLELLASWLNPGGFMLFSNRVKTRTHDETQADLAKRTAANMRVAQMLDNGELNVEGNSADLLARLDRCLAADENRPGEFRNVDEIRTLLDASALSVSSFNCIEWEIGGIDRPTYRRKRVLSVLTRGPDSPTP